ncbi:MAG: transcription termination/antitermination NusG family protein [Victivallaceae bacterium]|nr:transcription termination/antitermination NusG family protein [Victivallaceae bacterium]
MEEKKFWTPVRTKPRQEKKLAKYCAVNGIPHYLPLLHKIHHYQNRTAEFSSPMFPGYVFCRLDEAAFSRVRLSNTVAYKIDIDAESERTLIGELKAIRVFERMSDTCAVEVRPELAAGTPVEVIRGPFRGLSGIVQSRKNKLLLIISIELLGQAAAVEINASDLEIQ